MLASLATLRPTDVSDFAEHLFSQVFPTCTRPRDPESLRPAPGFARIAPDSPAGRKVLSILLSGDPEWDEENRDVAVQSLISNGEVHAGWFFNHQGHMTLVTGDAAFDTSRLKAGNWTFYLVADGYHAEAAGLTAHERLAALAHPIYGRMNAISFAKEEYTTLTRAREQRGLPYAPLIGYAAMRNLELAALQQRVDHIRASITPLVDLVRQEGQEAEIMGDAADAMSFGRVADLLARAIA